MYIEFFPSGPVATNCVLIGCTETKKAAIIDAPESCTDLVIKKLDQQGFSPQTLLLTHTHWDHIVDAANLKKRLNIPIYVHELDAENLKKPGSDRLPLFVDVPSCEPDRFLKEGDHITVGELDLEVLHTPGHCPGSICFYLKDQALLISGDTLFKGSIGRLDLPTSEPKHMWSSLEKLAQLPPETRVIPGHGEETTIGAETWLSEAKHYFGG